MRVLITKETVPEAFNLFCNNQRIRLLKLAFICFEKVDFALPHTRFDWIFFTSPRSVAFFLDNIADVDIMKKVNIACIGNTTKESIEKYGLTVQFTGVNSGDPHRIAEEFKNRIGESKVLFPQSNRSNRSIQQFLTSAQIIDVIVYKTELIQKKITDTYDVVIFTSPSNVDGFLLENIIPIEISAVISWGKTTSKKLKENNIPIHQELKTSSFEELQKVMQRLLTI